MGVVCDHNNKNGSNKTAHHFHGELGDGRSNRYNEPNLGIALAKGKLPTDDCALLCQHLQFTLILIKSFFIFCCCCSEFFLASNHKGILWYQGRSLLSVFASSSLLVWFGMSSAMSLGYFVSSERFHNDFG